MTESECAIECEGRRAARYTGTCCEFDFIVTLMNYFLRLVALLSACWVTGSGAQSAPPIFVLNSQDANITVIDPQTWAPIKQIPTGKEPHHLYLTPDEKSVIVANAGADSLTFIDPRVNERQRVCTCIGHNDRFFVGREVQVVRFFACGNLLDGGPGLRVNHRDVGILRVQHKDGGGRLRP